MRDKMRKEITEDFAKKKEQYEQANPLYIDKKEIVSEFYNKNPENTSMK